MSPISQTSFLVGTFFAISNSKPALIMSLLFTVLHIRNCEEKLIILHPNFKFSLFLSLKKLMKREEEKKEKEEEAKIGKALK